MGTTYRLILQSGPDSGQEFLLEKPELYIGRDLNNSIVINDPEVSRRHARLSLQAGNYVIEDLGSTNGTFIRGQRLAAPVVLRPGELVTLGEEVVLRYEVKISDPDATRVVQRMPAEPRPAAAAPVAPPAVPVVNPKPVMPVVPPPNVKAGKPEVRTPGTKKKSKLLIILLIFVAILVVFCVIPWIIIDLTNSYCSLTPGLWNLIIPGYCA
jgi:pSer/pThr/pTyr-binding forkhead associated (FHA) protein